MLKRQLMRAAKEQKVQLPVIEKDHALGWFLEGLGKNSFLKNRLLLKAAQAQKVQLPVVEKDYVLGCFLVEGGVATLQHRVSF